MLLLATTGKPGFAVAGLMAGVGVVLILIGGIAPFFRVFFSAPETALLMLVSRSARFEMMRRPDDDPYKRIVHESFDSMRGVFWRGVLLVIAIIPAGILYTAVPGLRDRGNDAVAVVEFGPAPPSVQNAAGRFSSGPVQLGTRTDRPQPYSRPEPVSTHSPPLQTTNPEPDTSPLRQTDDWPARRPFSPVGRPRADASPRAAGDQLFYNLLKFESGSDGTPRELLELALSEVAQYVPGTLSVEETSGQAQFETRGRIDSLNLANSLRKRGLTLRGLRSSNRPLE